MTSGSETVWNARSARTSCRPAGSIFLPISKFPSTVNNFNFDTWQLLYMSGPHVMLFFILWLFSCSHRLMFRLICWSRIDVGRICNEYVGRKAFLHHYLLPREFQRLTHFGWCFRACVKFRFIFIRFNLLFDNLHVARGHAKFLASTIWSIFPTKYM